MIEVNGKFGNAKIFNDLVDETSLSQIYHLLSSPIAKNANIRIMPDIHAGAGCVIGSTFEIGDIVIPGVVGVDIGCGVLAINLGKIDIDFSALDNFIRNNIPSGFSVNNNIEADVKIDSGIGKRMLDIAVKIELDYGRDVRSLGTLGGGNHFIEIDKDENNNKWLLIHSGSRNFGLKIANYHQKKANESCGGKMEGLAYLSGDMADEYYEDMKVAQEFAILNRVTMSKKIIDYLEVDSIEKIESVHNYINFDDGIVRKGAISAKEGEPVIIPLNMADGAIIGTGKGNEDWNFSAPHGAGRLMSRSKAKETINLEDFQKVMDDAGVWTSCVSKSTLDESPFAYKNADDILRYLEPTVDVTHRIYPIYNFKAS